MSRITNFPRKYFSSTQFYQIFLFEQIKTYLSKFFNTKIFPWLLVIYIAFVFIQSLFFKFAGSEETVIIFNTIGDWMAGIGILSGIAEPFRNYGGWVIGGAELIASVLLFIPKPVGSGDSEPL